jgi:beta-lactamase superfamily II metal-dependent hydrolase
MLYPRSKRLRAAALLILLALCSCEQKPQGPTAAGLNATFFDVGQGDAALLKTADATVVIDTGHNGDIVRLLRQEGVSHIDLLILSHPHEDHIGGLGAILRSFPIAEIWYAGEYRAKARRMLDRAPLAEVVVATPAPFTSRVLVRLVFYCKSF